ncbi:MAG: sulfurtransferase [Woeseia sp.]
MARSDVLIDVQELREQLSNPAWRIVDCRFELTEPDKGFLHYLENHIPGAVYAHLDRDLAAPVTAETGRHPLPDPAAFAGTLGRWGISRRSKVVVYDGGNGAIASRLWWMLRWMGHQAVRLLDGGLAAWKNADFPLESDPPEIEPAVFEGSPDPSMIVRTGEVEKALARGTPYLLVDARDPARFAGITEPIDRVAGHIPGARNFPFNDSLSEDGRWRSQDDLRRVWVAALEGAGGSAETADWTAMCGSGVTACHLAVSAELAGVARPRLYPGSWSEWIRDPARPIAPCRAEPEPSPAEGR